MNFLYHQNAGQQSLRLDGEDFLHIFKSRRTSANATLKLANLRDFKIYAYKIDNLAKHHADLALDSEIFSNFENLKSQKGAHIILAIIEPKIIEKTLPFLNELNVQKITFFYSSFSQKNFKPNFERLQKILINSCQQCGRLSLLELEIQKDLKAVLGKYDCAVLDFDCDILDSQNCKFFAQKSIIIGAEGGFSESEREILKSHKIPAFAIPNSQILRSETACIFAASALNLGLQ